MLILGDRSSTRGRASAVTATLLPLLLVALAVDCAARPEANDEPEVRAASARVTQTPIATPTATLTGEAATPRLPGAGGALAPALTEVAEGISGHVLGDISACGECHPDVVSHWQTSAHAWASFNNPIYRTSIERFREVLGRDRSRFCAGCHDPALLVDGAMDAPVVASDRRAHVGVTCLTCHGIDRATNDGNGSYHLGIVTPLLPDLDQPATIAAHKAQMAGPTLRQPELCASCHRAFLGASSGHPVHFAGTDDPGPWQASAFAGHPRRADAAIDAKTCAQCHMPQEAATLGDRAATDGKVASHRFLGGHTWLAAIRGDDEALALTRRFLEGVASVDIAAARIGPAGRERYLAPADGAAIAAGDRLEFEVVARNLAVGHRFPGGTRDSQDTRIAVTIFAADGRRLATTDEPHVLRSAVLGPDGHPRLGREVEDLRVGAYDHTLQPRDAAVNRYALTLPSTLAPSLLPLRVEATIEHRSRAAEVASLTCEASKTAAARAFLRETAQQTGTRLQPCAEQPRTIIARASIELGEGASVSDDRRRYDRLYDLGLALTHELQERLDRPRTVLESALTGARGAGDRGAEARILAALAEVATHQGRVDDALALADEAEAAGVTGAQVEILRGHALAAVWRWGAATGALTRVSEAYPGDPQAWRELAVARGSFGDAEGSLAAAVTGLGLAPRDPDLLRVQALALRELGLASADAALDASLEHRPADIGPQLRARCSREAPGCARERLPVHVHPMTWGEAPSSPRRR